MAEHMMHRWSTWSQTYRKDGYRGFFDMRRCKDCPAEQERHHYPEGPR